MRRLLLLLWVLVGLFESPVLHAAEPGDELRISLLTMGPGEHPFTKFGHSAIWVHNALTLRDEIYNYGTFAFDSPTLVLDSVAGTLPYWLSVQSMSGTLRTYSTQGRSLLASELELTPSERVRLHAALRENARPEHRYYRYDYYRDNCATRVRDIFDRVLGRQIWHGIAEPASMTYRAHTQRLVADAPGLYAALDVAIGRETDVPVTFWDEAWLPERLHALFARATVTHDGRILPLIRSERTLLASRFPTPRATPPLWFRYYGIVGLVLGASLGALGHYFAASGRRALRIVLGALYFVLGTALGLLGCALCYLTFFSSHSAAASNYNVLLLPPWLLALSVAGVGVMRGKARAFRIAHWAAWGALGSSLLACFFHVSSAAQSNLQELAVVLPVWIGVMLSARQTRSRKSGVWRASSVRLQVPE